VIHDLADVESQTIGKNTNIWQFCVVLPDAKIGSDCNICAHVFIENDVVIGDRVTVKSGVQLWDGLRIENDVFIGPNATFTNDLRPRSKSFGVDGLLEIILQKGCSVGANATVLPGIEVGEYSMVAAGSVVTHSVKSHSLVMGNPATSKGWVCKCAKKLEFVKGKAVCCSYEYTLNNDVLEVNDVN
jgi:UDP-2-acetamido-3-amino-2,3-dideoxy-glucuronate N-acetyltransferase